MISSILCRTVRVLKIGHCHCLVTKDILRLNTQNKPSHNVTIGSYNLHLQTDQKRFTSIAAQMDDASTLMTVCSLLALWLLIHRTISTHQT